MVYVPFSFDLKLNETCPRVFVLPEYAVLVPEGEVIIALTVADDKPLFTNGQQLQLFAAAVGYSQATVNDELGRNDKDKPYRKPMRNQVLMWGKNVQSKIGNPELIHYLTELKVKLKKGHSKQ